MSNKSQPEPAAPQIEGEQAQTHERTFPPAKAEPSAGRPAASAAAPDTGYFVTTFDVLGYPDVAFVPYAAPAARNATLTNSLNSGTARVRKGE